MTLGARYDADFESFYNAVEKARQELLGWEKEGAAVESQMNQVSDSLNQVPAGVKQASTEVKGLGSVASTVGGQIAGMLTIGAATAYANEIFALTGEVTKLAAATGLSVEQAQEFMHIAQATNTPITALTGAMQTMQEKIGRGDAGLNAALEDLGVNMQEFARMNTGDQFRTAAAALAKMGDETKFAANAADIFGGKWKGIAPAVKADMDELAKLAPKMSEATTKTLETMYSDWQRFWSQVKVNTATEIAGIAGMLNGLATSAGNWATTIAGQPAKLAEVSGALHTLKDEGNGVKLTEEELAKIYKESDKTIAEAAKRNEELAEAQANLRLAGEGYLGVLAEMNPATVASVKGWLEAGAAQKDLATIYGQTEQQIEAVAIALDKELEALEAKARAQEFVTQVTRDRYQLEIEQSGTATEAAIADIERWSTETIEAMQAVGAATPEVMDAIAEQTHALMNNVLIDFGAVKANSMDIYRKDLEEIAQRAEATYQYMVGHSENFTMETIQQFAETARAAREAADNWVHSWQAGAEEAGEAVTKATTKAKKALEDVFHFGQTGTGGGAGSQKIDTSGIQILNMEEAMAQYAGVYGGKMTPAGMAGNVGMIGGGPAKDFVSWALDQGLAVRNPPAAVSMPATGGAGMNTTVNLNGLLGTNDPQTRDLVRRLVGEAMTGAMRESRLLGRA